MSGTATETPRVRFRLGVEDERDERDLPFVVAILGDFSGAEARGAGAFPREAPRFLSCLRTPAEEEFDDAQLGPAELMRTLLPRVALGPLPLMPGGAVLHLAPAAAAAEAEAAPLHPLSPAAIAVSRDLPPLRLAVLLRQGLLQLRQPRFEAGPPPDAVTLARRLAEACRRAATAGLGDERLDGMPDLPAGAAAPLRALALAGWIDIAVAQLRRLAALPPARQAESGFGPLRRLDAEGALAVAVRDLLVPLLWEALGAATPASPPPWTAEAAPLPIRLLIEASEGELRAMLLGAARPDPACAGWLAARLEVLAEAMVTAVLRDPGFRALEANWRALAHLLDAARMPGCEIRLIDMPKEAVRDDLLRATTPERSRLCQLIHGEGLGALSDRPTSLLLCLFEIGPGAAEAELALRLAQLGRAAVCPVLCSAGPDLLDAALAEPPEGSTAAWQRARQDAAADFLGLCAPRLLARCRHRDDPACASPLRYEEPPVADPAALPWVGGAVALAERTITAFQRYNWYVAVTGTAEDHGIVAPLAREPIGTAGALAPPVERVLTEAAARRAAIAAGIAAMVHLPGRDAVAFLDAPSLFGPDPAAGAPGPETLLRRLAARLPYAFAGTRVAHHLLVTLRRQVGRAGLTSVGLQALANRWLAEYVAWQADAATATRAEKPLRRAQAKVAASEARPGWFAVEVSVQPHFQLDALGLDFTLVTSLPAGAAPDRTGRAADAA
jgi:type VI secretion system protein ImpC